MSSPSRIDYFAYGSNLSLTQMAERCPASLLRGHATLRGYRWQINERGVANVVKAEKDQVEGLVFSVNAREQKVLDRSEGISRGFYERQMLSVRLVEWKEPTKTAFVSRKLQEDDVPRVDGPTTDIQALVYVSSRYNQDGLIREEYVGRMQRAVDDAVRLGVSSRYIQQRVRPFLSGPVMESQRKVPDHPQARARVTPASANKRGDGESTDTEDKEIHKNEPARSGEVRSQNNHQTCKDGELNVSRSGPQEQEEKLEEATSSGQEAGLDIDVSTLKEEEDAVQSPETTPQSIHGKEESKTASKIETVTKTSETQQDSVAEDSSGAMIHETDPPVSDRTTGQYVNTSTSNPGEVTESSEVFSPSSDKS